MAARGQRKDKRTGPMRRSFGTYTLHGGEEGIRLTITSDLDPHDFPNELGKEVAVDLVEAEDESYLEVRPVGGE